MASGQLTYSAKFMFVWEIEALTRIPKTSLYVYIKAMIATQALPPLVDVPDPILRSNRIKYAFDRQAAYEHIHHPKFRERFELAKKLVKAWRKAERELAKKTKNRISDLERENLYSTMAGMLPATQEELDRIIKEKPDPAKTNLSAMLFGWRNTVRSEQQNLAHANVARILDDWVGLDFEKREFLLSNKYLKNAIFDVKVEYKRARSSPKHDTCNIYAEVRPVKQYTTLILPLSSTSADANAGIARICKAINLPNGSSSDPKFYNREPPPEYNPELDETIKSAPVQEMAAAYYHLQTIKVVPVDLGAECARHRLLNEIEDIVERIQKFHKVKRKNTLPTSAV